MVNLPANAAFDNPTARELSEYIQSELLHKSTANNIEQIKVNLDEPIAIIGMSCRFPGANNIDEFWQLLSSGGDGIKAIPNSRWNNDDYYDSDLDIEGKLYIERLGLLENVQSFDADFFGISPREAQLIEPQQRLLLEESYHALESGGITPSQIKGTRTGVFVGVGANEYHGILQKQGVATNELNAYFATGAALNVIAGRIAFSFDLHGPSEAIDTACSSSLVALHNACQSLRMGDCDAAFAGGVNVILSPDTNIALCQAKNVIAR